MKILLVDNKTSYLAHLQHLLEEFGQVEVVEHIQSSVEDSCDLVVLSGGHHAYITEQPEEYRHEIEFIQQSKKPILGVCLGAEILAHTFGAKLKVLPEKAKGLVVIDVIERDRIFGAAQSFVAYENHQVAITALSSELQGLAKSPTGFEIIKHESKPFYGFQFHPEIFQDRSYGDEVFRNTMRLLR